MRSSQYRQAKLTGTISRLRWRTSVSDGMDASVDRLTQPPDTTVEWARDMVHKLNGGKAQDILQHRIQCVKYVGSIITA